VAGATGLEPAAFGVTGRTYFRNINTLDFEKSAKTAICYNTFRLILPPFFLRLRSGDPRRVRARRCRRPAQHSSTPGGNFMATIAKSGPSDSDLPALSWRWV
jgi:hypothetical protein